MIENNYILQLFEAKDNKQIPDLIQKYNSRGYQINQLKNQILSLQLQKQKLKQRICLLETKSVYDGCKQQFQTVKAKWSTNKWQEALQKLKQNHQLEIQNIKAVNQKNKAYICQLKKNNEEIKLQIQTANMRLEQKGLEEKHMRAKIEQKTKIIKTMMGKIHHLKTNSNQKQQQQKEIKQQHQQADHIKADIQPNTIHSNPHNNKAQQTIRNGIIKELFHLFLSSFINQNFSLTLFIQHIQCFDLQRILPYCQAFSLVKTTNKNKNTSNSKEKWVIDSLQHITELKQKSRSSNQFLIPLSRLMTLLYRISYPFEGSNPLQGEIRHIIEQSTIQCLQQYIVTYT